MLGRLVEKEVAMCFWEIVNNFSRFRKESGPYCQSGKTIYVPVYFLENNGYCRKYWTILFAMCTFTFLFVDYYTENVHVYLYINFSENNLLVVPFTRSSVVQQCAFSAAGPRLWNSLPLSLRSASCLSVFKSHLKTYLFKEYYG